MMVCDGRREFAEDREYDVMRNLANLPPGSLLGVRYWGRRPYGK